MNDKVYVIANYGAPVYQRGSRQLPRFESHFDSYQDFLSAKDELRFGHGFPEDKLPEALEFSLEYYFGDHAEEGINYAADAELDHICAAEVPYVSPEMKAVLEQFDLGATTLPPVQVTVLRSNGTRTPYERYYLNLRSVKDCVVLDQSYLIPPMKPMLPPPPDAPPRPYQVEYHIKHQTKPGHYTLEPEGLTLSRKCLAEPDLWTDPMIEYAAFAKGPLIKALKAAGLVDNMELQEVTLV